MAANNTAIDFSLPDFEPGEVCKLGTCPMEYANFTYVPSLPGNVTYLAIFAVLLAAQLFLGVRHRTWSFLVGMAGGLILEIIGYVGRIQLHYNPFPFNPFLIQLVCLTIAPAFLTASIYLTLGRLIRAYTPALSRLAPRTYTIVFMSCDLLSLILQAAGGGITATADRDQADMRQAGINVMIAGLAAQVASLAVFVALAGEYAWRVGRARAAERFGGATALNAAFAAIRSRWVWKAGIAAIAGATLTIFVRCVYRVAELQEGFNGDLANDEVVFMVLEGPMIIAACALLTAFHPGVCFGGRWAEASGKVGAKTTYGKVQVQSDSEMELQGGRQV